MKARYPGIGLSLLLFLASIGLFIKPGLNYGIDSTCGIQVEITTSGTADLARLRSQLGGLGLGEITLQQIGGDDNVLIRVQRQEGGEAAQMAAIGSVRDTLAQIDPGMSVERTEVVGPEVSGELAREPIRLPDAPGIGTCCLSEARCCGDSARRGWRRVFVMNGGPVEKPRRASA